MKNTLEQQDAVLNHPNIRELSPDEMELIIGGNPVGAAAGGLGYLGGAAISGDFSLGGFGTSIAVGGLSGATMGATAFFGAYAVPRISYLGGMAIEAVEMS